VIIFLLKSTDSFLPCDPSRSLLRAHSRIALLLPMLKFLLDFTEKYNMATASLMFLTVSLS